MLKTIIIYIWAVLATAVIGAISAGLSFLDKTGNKSHLGGRIWGESIIDVSGITVKVNGMHNITPGKSYIYMPNHQSNFDIPILMARLKVQFRWLAKAELFHIPFFGFVIKSIGCISIDRSNREKAIKSLKQAAETIRNGTSVVIFPEGTRSKDGSILPFKKGGIMLSITAGIPIIPVVITGTNQIMPKNKLNIKPGPVVIDILEPVETASYTGRNKEELISLIRNRMTEVHNKRSRELKSC